MHAAKADAGFSLLFAVGSRPAAADVSRLLSASAETPSPAQVSSTRAAAEGWLELLYSGLTFDLTGLSPAASVSIPPASHFYGLARSFAEQEHEAVGLFPGPHLADGAAMVPVVQAMAAVVGDLAVRFKSLAVCWRPARCWMDPGYFARIAAGWSTGGAFPALGMTAIEQLPEGGVESVGLAYFIGQEMRLEAQHGESAAETVKLAGRMIDYLVRHGPVAAREVVAGPFGETLIADPSKDGRYVRISRSR